MLPEPIRANEKVREVLSGKRIIAGTYCFEDGTSGAFIVSRGRELFSVTKPTLGDILVHYHRLPLIERFKACYMHRPELILSLPATILS